MSYWNQEQIEITRDDLYQQVWEEPVSKIAPRYGISDVGLKKICVKLNVPVPPRGYWAKLANGKTPRKRALPKIGKGEPTSIKIAKRKPREIKPDSPSTPVTGPQFWPHPRISASTDVGHPIVLKLVQDYATAKVGEDGLLHSRRMDAWPLKVSQDNRDRYFRILDGLLRSFDSVGHAVSLGTNWFECTTEFGIVKFELLETMKSVERNPNKEERERDRDRLRYYANDERNRPRYYRDIASGLLAITIQHEDTLNVRKVWSDSEKSKLENQLTSFASGMLRFADARKVAADKAEKRRLEREEWQRQWREEENRRRAEQTRRDKLATAIKSWSEANDIRTFAEAFESEARARFGGDLSADVLDWIQWIRRRADLIDPLKADLMGVFPQS